MTERAKLESKVIQIIPAYGWCAVYGEKENPDGWKKTPLIDWALLEIKMQDKDLGTTICGVDTDSEGNVLPVRQRPNFLRYYI